MGALPLNARVSARGVRQAAAAANAAMDVLEQRGGDGAVSWTDARKAACSVGLWYET